MSNKYRGAGKDFGNTQLKSVADPSASSDAATKGYVDALVNGLVWHPAVRVTVASNVTVSNPGTAVFDTETLVNGDRILLRGQSAPAENGPWVFTGSGTAMTRPADFANAVVAPPATGIINATFYVSEGSAPFQDTAWTLSTDGTITVGTTALTFTQFGGGGAYTADGQGIELATTTFSLELDGTSLSKSGTGLRIGSAAAGDGLVESGGILAVGAGSGVSVAANAVAVDSTVGRVFQTGTHAATTSIAVTHSLGKQFVCAHVFVTATGEEIECDVVATSTTVTTFSFAVAPTLNTLTFVIHA